MPPPIIRSHRPRYSAGELIPCSGCHRAVARVARHTVAYARRLLTEQDATPGSTVALCHRCKTLTEVRSESEPDAQAAA